MKKLFSVFMLVILAILISCETPARKVGDDTKSDYGKISKADKKDLKEEKSIYGKIIDSKTKSSIKNATIEIKNANMGVGYYLVKSKSGGSFKIDDFIPHIQYILEVNAEGYVPYKTSGTLRPGKRNIYLDPETVVKGKITDSSGRPVKGAEIKISQGSGYYSRVRPKFYTTKSDGNYSFNKLPYGSYIVTINKPGYIAETVRIKYLNKGEVFRLPYKIYRPAKLKGKVLIKGLNVPAPNVQIVAEGHRRHAVSTFRDGSYVIDDLMPGRYKMKVYHQGFYKVTEKYITIREGQTYDNFNYSLTPQRPETNLSAYRHTFAPGNEISFNMQTFRLESVIATVYKVPLNSFLKGRTDPSKLNVKKEKFKKYLSWKEEIQNFKPYQWKYQTLKINKPLPTGGYCIEVRGANNVVKRKYFTVTSTGIVVKRSQDSVFVYASNLVTNKPEANASIVVFDSTPEKEKYKNNTYPYNPPKRIEELPVEIIKKGKADKDGVFHYKFNSSKHVSVLAVGSDNSYAICSTGSPSKFDREKNKYFIYTDRPVYRSGDTVFYKVVAKSRQTRFSPISGKTFYYQITNGSRGQVVEEGTMRLDSWGTAHAKLNLKERDGLGTFYVKAGPSKNNLYAYGYFYVEQYRKPEFKVEIKPSKDFFVNRDTAEFRVEAKYFFGAPLKGALVRYRFYETQLDDRDGYWWEDEYNSRSAYNKIKLEGEKYLDDNGIAALRIDTGDFPFDRDITLEVSVIDNSNVAISSTKKVRIGRGEFYIKLTPDKNFYADNEKKNVTVQTLDHTGKPVTATVSLDLKRYIWKPYQRVYVHEKRSLFKKRIRTGKDGKAKVELPKDFDFYGEFDLLANASDRKGNKINASKIIWIYSKHGKAIDSKLKNLELVVNKTKLSDKETEMTCLIKSRYTDAYVCLTVEGRDIYQSKVVKMTGNIVPVTIKVNNSYAPNFYVTATMQRKRALYTRSQNISIPVKDTEIDFDIKSDKDVYKPGDKVKVEITAKNSSGKPVSADVSLAAVDESIYQIRRDHTSNMKEFFYSKISNWVMTAYSYPINMLAGASKDGKVKVRSKFDDTTFWKANIKTGINGKASIEFTLPDNLTIWRLTARGHDKAGRMGQSIFKFQVTKDIISRIAKPRFFVEGDKMKIIGIVNNNSNRGIRKVDTKMKVGGKTILPDKKMNISLSPFGSSRSYYSFKVPQKKANLDLYFESKSSSGDSDALLWTVPVKKRGSTYKMFGLGDFNNNRTVTLTKLEENDDYKFVPEQITISLNPSPIYQMLKANDYLISYPYGCIEQTMNRFTPIAAVHSVLKRGNLSELIPDKQASNLPQYISAGLSKIYRYQNSDGSWGWFAGDRGNEFLTGYVLFALKRLEADGYRIDKTYIRRGLRAVNTMLSPSSNVKNEDAKAYLFYVKNLHGSSDTYGWDWAISQVSDKDLNVYQAAFIARGISAGDKNGFFKYKKVSRENALKAKDKAIAFLKQKVKRDSKGIYWPSSRYQSWGWQGASTEMTAHVLSALIDVKDKSQFVSQAVSSLSKRFEGDSWKTTKQTATVIFALCDYIDSTGGLQTEPANISFSMDGKQIASFRYDPKNLKSAYNYIKDVDVSGFESKDSVKITASGNAGADATFDIVAKGTIYFKPGGVMSIFKSEARGLEKLSNGVLAHRTYRYLTRVKDIHHKEYLMPGSLKDHGNITVGEELMVNVKFTAQDNFEFLMVEDFLPAGFEVIKEDVYDDYKPYIHREKWDDKMVYFFKNVQKGKVYELSYIIRAELPGEFFTRPARVECMYEPSIQGWSAPSQIEVDMKKK